MPHEHDRTDSLPVIGGADTGGPTRILPAAADARDDLNPEDAAVYDTLTERRRDRRRKTIRRRAIAAGAAVLVIALAVFAVGALTREPERAPEAVTDVAMRGTYSTAVDASGTLEPLSSTVITPEVEGTVAEIRVVAGQSVKKGDVLLTLKNDELDRAIETARRELATAQGALADAQDAEAEAERAYYADEVGEVPVETVNSAIDAVSAAEDAVAKARDAYDQAVAAGAKRTLTAPADGNVVALNAQVGAAVGAAGGVDASKPLVQIADISQMRVTVQVDEESIAKVAKDQEAAITFPAFPDVQLTGTVVGIASVATGAGEGGGAYYGEGAPVTFAVDVLVPEPDQRLKPGMTANVSLTTEKIDDVIMVPVTALQTDDGASYYVNVETDPETHASERRDVTVIAQNDSLAVVGRPEDAAGEMEVSPLADGETLVISGGAGGADALGSEAALGESGGGAA